MSNPLSNRFLVLLYLFLISISASFLPSTATPSLSQVSIAPSSAELENRRIHSESVMEERIGQSVGVGGSFGRIRGNDFLGRAGMGYNNPMSDGGSMLTIVNGTYPAGQGEPLNMILSSDSAKEVMVDSPDNGGFLNYMLSTYMGEECLGQHLGAPQQANLGDGAGAVDEIQELRWNFGNPYLGTCQETFNGGLHLRYWIQNTTGAYFIAISVEKSLADQHDIVIDGYNLGRDYLVGNLTNQTSVISTSNVTNQTTFSGNSAYGNWTYNTKVNYVSGLLKNTSVGINHNITVQTVDNNAIDGLVAVLTVTVVDRPKSSLAWTTLRTSIPTLLLALSATAVYSIL